MRRSTTKQLGAILMSGGIKRHAGRGAARACGGGGPPIDTRRVYIGADSRTHRPQQSRNKINELEFFIPHRAAKLDS